MHKRLIIVRHAKSSWKDKNLTDHQRPLNKRGRRDAPRIGKALAERGWIPERVLSSDSTRTQETWAGLVDGLHKGGATRDELEAIDLTFTRELYLYSVNDAVSWISTVGERIECLLVLGHNPGTEELIAWTSAQAERITTANAALLTTDAKDWMTAISEPSAFDLETLLRPKDLDS